MMHKHTSFGINPQSSLMYPCSEEVSQVLTVCHGAAVVVLGKKIKQKVYGIKYNQSEKSQKPWSEDIAQCLSAQCHDAAVVVLRKSKKKKENILAFTQNTRDEVRLIGKDGSIAGSLMSESGMKQQTYIVVKKKVPHGATKGVL